MNREERRADAAKKRLEAKRLKKEILRGQEMIVKAMREAFEKRQKNERSE